ncbi:MAG: class II glutamine amidotransferase [Motiliproteus sp.]
MKSKLNITAAGELLSINGDGFGIGWYHKRPEPGVFTDDKPAWHDENLKNLCHQVESHIFFAHIRATTTGDVQRSNCHPFQYQNWLFQHNGHVSNFESIRRELLFQIAPELFPAIKGTTDSETFFLLAITYGLMNRPKEALQKMVHCVLNALNKVDPNGVLNLSSALSDGQKLYTLRFSHNEEAMTQFYSTDTNCINSLNDSPISIPSDSVVVVSEPLDRASDKWIEIPNNSFTTFSKQGIVIETFLTKDDES